MWRFLSKKQTPIPGWRNLSIEKPDLRQSDNSERTKSKIGQGNIPREKEPKVGGRRIVILFKNI
jgi:hypothetical protein